MLGKNQIQRIENLKTLLKLDVLDLHSNRIKEIQNVSHLKHLRTLGCRLSHAFEIPKCRFHSAVVGDVGVS